MCTEVLVAVLAVLAGTVACLRAWYRSVSGHCKSKDSMEGKTAIITGATAGIGKEAARDLLRRGARVIIACRNLEKGAKVAGELRTDAGSAGEVVVRHLDTADLASIRTFAKEVLESEKAIHVLIKTADDLEMIMATTNFGHFLLTNLLEGRLKESAPSRVVTVSSACNLQLDRLQLEELIFERESVNAHNKSKLCNVLFVHTVADKMTGTGEWRIGVSSNSQQPSVVNTSILDNVPFSVTTETRRLDGSALT